MLRRIVITLLPISVALSALALQPTARPEFRVLDRASPHRHSGIYCAARRDALQARVVAQFVSRHPSHLPFEADALRMIPRNLFGTAAPLFEANAAQDPY